MTDSKSGSKSDLNESNMPLLDDDQAEKAGETPEKEQIELKEGVEEKDDSKETEKEEEGGKKKKKKEKKVKVPKEKKPAGPNCIDIHSAGLDMGARDVKEINTLIDFDFGDVLAEPGSAHGFDPIWRFLFVLFTQTKLWLYRILAAVVAVPATLIWALVFSVLTVVYVWILTPALRIFDLGVAVARRLFVGVMRCTLEPVCAALGAVFSQVNVAHKQNIIQEA